MSIKNIRECGWFFHSESCNYDLTVSLGRLVLIRPEHESPIDDGVLDWYRPQHAHVVDDKTVAKLVGVDLGSRSRGNATEGSVEEMRVQKQNRSSR